MSDETKPCEDPDRTYGIYVVVGVVMYYENDTTHISRKETVSEEIPACSTEGSKDKYIQQIESRNSADLKYAGTTIVHIHGPFQRVF